MPFVWIGLSALSGIITGVIWEKETEKPVVIDSKTGKISWWDKTLLAVLGVCSFYIWKRFK